jgi:peptide-methionine (R)-S-oxide reductase
MSPKKYNIEKTDHEWRTQLSEQEYHILREKGTEIPHTGIYNLHFKEGNYTCKGCGTALFTSDSKFQSHCGWPSFDRAAEKAIEYRQDTSHHMLRTEILCANCGGHLGHVFNDGPTETGVRFCVNSASLTFLDDTENVLS